jgi:hypothetical protein
MINKLYSVLVNFKTKTLKDEILFFSIVIICFYFFLFFLSIFQYFLDLYLVLKYDFSVTEIIIKNRNENFERFNLLDVIFILCFFIPTIEELIHRLPLVLSKWNIAIALSLSYFAFTDGFFYYNLAEKSTIIKLSLTLITFIIFYFIDFKKIMLEKRYYIIYVLLMSIVFGLLHLINFYSEVPKNCKIFSLIFIFPQITLGMFSSLLRIKIGFIYSVLFHILFNSSIFILNLYIK